MDDLEDWLEDKVADYADQELGTDFLNVEQVPAKIQAQAFSAVFQMNGGLAWLRNWSLANTTEFFKIYFGLLKIQLQNASPGEEIPREISDIKEMSEGELEAELMLMKVPKPDHYTCPEKMN